MLVLKNLIKYIKLKIIACCFKKIYEKDLKSVDKKYYVIYI